MIKTCGKTEIPTKFTLHTEWEPIESEAEELGKTNFAREVRGFDLCAVEEKYHTSCHRSFKTECHNFKYSQ